MKTGDRDFEELSQLEERLWIAEFRFDRVWMDSVLADDFIEFGRSGRIYAREECLDVAGGAIDAVMPLQEFRLCSLGADAVLATYKSRVTYVDEVECANRSSIWLKTAQGWKLKFHQGTPAPAA